jgi:2-C-methyl-D-erythritol 4-phosphate cytidylyltransferase/2-C-methyl-D-erythritol 2,4-cyclodiphosphate synthase
VAGSVAIVLAAGEGRRVGAPEPKAFLTIGGRSILSVAAAAAVASPSIDGLIVTVPPGMEGRAMGELDGIATSSTVVTGGRTRHASVRAALAFLGTEVDAVACHDAARPFAPPDLFTAVLEALTDGIDGAIPVLPITDTVKRVHDGMVVATEPRSELGLAQTPQAFRVHALRDAHARAETEGIDLSDDAAVLEWAGYRVRVIPGDPSNFKITTLGDLARAETLMAGSPADG